MKKTLSFILCLICFVFLIKPVVFGTNTNIEAKKISYTITVNGKIIDLKDLPYSAYKKGDTIMVPLHIIAEALDYDVSWLSKTKQTVIEDSIQKAIVTNNSKTVQFVGKLKIINLDKEVELYEKIATHKKVTYVPVEFFEYFFNDVNVDGTSIAISIQMSQLQY